MRVWIAVAGLLSPSLAFGTSPTDAHGDRGRAAEGYDRMMSGDARFRVVLTPA